MGGQRGNPSQNETNRLARCVGAYLAVVWVLTAVKGWAYYRAHDGWAIGDWLINAAGGWVRRAICGEFFLHLSEISHINPGLLVWLTEITAYAAFFAFAYALLKRKSDLRPFALLIFSPFIFTFQLHGGGYRKEILYFVVLTAAAWGMTRGWHERQVRLWLAALTFTFPILVLAHEMLAIFLPYLLGMYAAASAKSWGRRGADAVDALTALGVLLTGTAFVFAITHAHASARSIRAMEAAISAHGYPLAGEGSLAWLATTIKQSVDYVLGAIFSYGYGWKYPLLLALVLVGYFPLQTTWHMPKTTLWLVKLSLAASAVMLIVMLDWGRMIYINAVSLFVYALVFTNPKISTKWDWRHWLGVAIYGSCWALPPYVLPVSPSPIFGLQWIKTLFKAS